MTAGDDSSSNSLPYPPSSGGVNSGVVGDAAGKKRPFPSGGKSTRDDHRADDDGDSSVHPFVMLPFHGDHRRAISAVAFAPTTGAAARGRNGGASAQNSNAGIEAASALCASASADGSSKMWDITSDMLRQAGEYHRHKMGGGTMSADLTMSSRLLNCATHFMGHNRGINDVCWSPTASYIATASDDKTLRLWDVPTGDPLVEFRGHTNFVFSCRFNPQSNLLVSGSFDETVKLWDVRCGECVSTMPAHSDPVTGVDFNRDGTCIVSGSHDGLIRIWDTATGECLKTIFADGNPPVSSVRFSPNGKFVLSGTLDSKLRLWDVAGRANAQPGGMMGRFGIGGAERLGGAGGSHRPRGGRCSKTYGGHQNTRFCAFATFSAVNPRRPCIVSGSEDHKVYLFDLQSRVVRQALEGHVDAVLAVDTHDSLEMIASGGMTTDKTVRFWMPLAAEKGGEGGRAAKQRR